MSKYAPNESSAWQDEPEPLFVRPRRLPTTFIVHANDEDAPFQRVTIDFDEVRNVPCPDCGSRVYARWWPQLRTWELTECVRCGAVFYSWWDGATEKS